MISNGLVAGELCCLTLTYHSLYLSAADYNASEDVSANLFRGTFLKLAKDHTLY